MAMRSQSTVAVGFGNAVRIGGNATLDEIPSKTLSLITSRRFELYDMTRSLYLPVCPHGRLIHEGTYQTL
jgi:hypothetical protein